mmetsp:Transcript_2520/g.5975  ORF Transcript_2520/g.5975 Transcript_2520/m.5975 type:complete len:85 (+) Transcript_2520:64-318(+)
MLQHTNTRAGARASSPVERGTQMESKDKEGQGVLVLPAFGKERGVHWRAPSGPESGLPSAGSENRQWEDTGERLLLLLQDSRED